MKIPGERSLALAGRRFGLTVAAGIAAFSSTLHAQDASIPPPSRYVATEVPAAQIDAAIAGLDKLVEDVMARSGIPGLAVAVVRNDETVYARGFGQRRVDAEDAVDPDTVFLLASLSKPLGATVIASQVAKGLVEWDTPIARLLPWFVLSDPWVTEHVTIGDLYAHRSGLPDHAGDDLEDLGFDRREVLERLALLPLSPFRSTYAYTNFGLTAAAEGVAEVVGTSWERLSQDALYEPLGMTSTSSLNADFLERANRSSSHIPQGDGYVVADLRQPDAQSAAGGASSSVNDMAKWMALVLQDGKLGGQTFIDPDALIPAITAQMISSPSSSADARAGMYGFGFNVGIQPSGRVSIGHSGAFVLGASTTVSMIPSLGIGIVVLTNAPPVGAVEAIAVSFLDELQFGAPTRDWLAAFQRLIGPIMEPTGELVGVARPSAPEPHRDLDAYLGVYQNAYFGDLEILSFEGGLGLVVGPAGNVERLAHWNGDDFTYRPFDESGPKGTISRVSFEGFDASQAREVVVEHLNDIGFGRFAR
ncbi:serine hydrolase [Tateyamaria pelophila]|uniref:serine hydrolase n=1 Tax=Tateyamaria pelophila TaxID=328415 RepID=UPI001CBDC6E5|nr:serine hydrolase [Tateyamaria pelophila]